MATAITIDYRRTAVKRVKPIPTGLDAVVYGLMGKRERRGAIRKELLNTAALIDKRHLIWREMSNSQLKAKIMEFKEIFHRRKTSHEAFLPDALAAIREAAERTLELRPYPVQLAGALALYKGMVAEMATGEGKTLTAALTAVIRGWSGLPCHIITVNDYLARRDANWFQPLFKFCGVSAGCVTSAMKADERRGGHAKNITYTTSKEIVADFLRDRLHMGKFQKSGRRHIQSFFGNSREMARGLVTRGIHTAIVDEADSVLIDEAVTPLIISHPQTNQPFVEACQMANAIADNLRKGEDYRVDLHYKDIELLPKCEARLEELAVDLPGWFRGAGRRQELIKQALTAREFYKLGKQYVIQDKKVVIVDEFTGRLMPMRTWQSGLHQLIEAKEGVQVTAPSETLARLSFQRFFRMFHNLSGMTGTAKEAADEFWHIYKLPVVSIPPNKKCLREQMPRRVYTTQEAKWDAIVKEIQFQHEEGKPVLVGTRSVAASDMLGKRLELLGLEHQILNAVRHNEEAQIVAQAGKMGKITVATNMAGRGTDIRLGSGVVNRGGLHVIATECHESGRIDRQLFGRSSRQGDPGSAQSFVSLEDELILRFGPKAFIHSLKKSANHNQRVSWWAGDWVARKAQRAAQKQAYKQRRSVLKMDTWLDDSLSFSQADVDE